MGLDKPQMPHMIRYSVVLIYVLFCQSVFMNFFCFYNFFCHRANDPLVLVCKVAH